MAVWAGAAPPTPPVKLELYSVTRFCWFRVPVPKPLMPIWNERFCQMMLLARIGFEMVRQPVVDDCPAGQVGGVTKVVVSSAEFRVLPTPASCGQDAVFVPVGPVRVQFPAGALAIGVPTLLVSTPEEARESLWAMVLLMMLTFNESCNEMPAPSQPAMLLLMMLLVMLTLFQRVGLPREGGDVRPVDLVQADATAAAAISRVALDQVGIDHQVATRAVAQSRRAIAVGHARANRIGIRRPLDHDPAAIGGDGGVAALIEQDRVVLDIAVLDFPEVSDPAALTSAEVAAHPVVVELVVVVAGAEGRAAAARERGGEQFVAEGGVVRDHVVMHVHVNLEAIRHVLVGNQTRAVAARAGRCDWRRRPRGTDRQIHPGRR